MDDINTSSANGRFFARMLTPEFASKLTCESKYDHIYCLYCANGKISRTRFKPNMKLVNNQEELQQALAEQMNTKGHAK